MIKFSLANHFGGRTAVHLIREKILESLKSVLPIALIVVVLSMTVVPMPTGDMMLFILGVVCLVFGMSLFTVGAEMSMQSLGTKIGSTIGKSKHVWLIAFIAFIIGILVTVSEPDLQILARQVGDIENLVLILTVSVGVGIFLLIAVLRILFAVSLRWLLVGFYAFAIVLSFFLPDGFKTIAFDSGGVTTGPMTVPFIMSLGAGVSVARKSSSANRDDSFGITALCSIGPIISVLVLGVILKIDGGNYTPAVLDQIADTREGIFLYAHGFLEYAPEVMLALFPIIVFAVIFQLAYKPFSKAQLIRMSVGVIYTLVGLAIFLTGANVGFVPMGSAIGASLAANYYGLPLIPIAMLLGYFMVKAEPSVYVLNKLVENMSAGSIAGSTTGLGLSIGVSAALGLASLRIITGLDLMYILIPGYAIALVLAFFVPKIFVGIAFDSGGVASGTMMSAFVLPLCTGACAALEGNVMTDAFGCVALVAMAPIISIEIMGLIHKIKTEGRVKHFVEAKETFVDYGWSDKRRLEDKSSAGGER